MIARTDANRAEVWAGLHNLATVDTDIDGSCIVTLSHTEFRSTIHIPARDPRNAEVLEWLETDSWAEVANHFSATCDTLYARVVDEERE